MSRGGTVEELERSIDELYRAPLDGFVAARNALAAQLRKAGHRGDADRVRALIKPSATAWAVNRVWWTEPELMQALLQAGEDERAAYAAFAAGRRADLRAAAARREQAASAVVDAALAALGKSGGPEARFRIAGTAGVLASGGLPADMLPGRLTRDLQATGFDALSGWAAAAAQAPDPVPETPRPSLVRRRSGQREATAVRQEDSAAVPDAAARKRAERLARAEAQLAALQSAADDLEAEHAAAAAALADARQTHEAAVADVARLERELEDARSDATGKRRVLNEATRRASEAEVRRARAARERDRLREEIEGNR